MPTSNALKFSYVGGHVSDAVFQKALDFISALEDVAGATCNSMEDFNALCVKHQAARDASLQAIKAFAQQMQPCPLEDMQRAYYSSTHTPKNNQTREQTAAISAIVNQQWNGVGPWQR